MGQTFKDNPAKKKITEILTRKKARKPIRKIIIETLNKAMEEK